MKEDIILKKFFEKSRWKSAIDKGIAKDINKAVLYKLCSTAYRIEMYNAIKDGTYNIGIPHTAYIPKDDGTNRVVFVNDPEYRVVLSICNDLLNESMPEMTHPQCKAYQKGIGCGMVVQEVSNRIVEESAKVGDKVVGWKADFTKYFDRVPRKYIHEAFDRVEAKYGASALISMLRRYYDNDLYIDTFGDGEGEIVDMADGKLVRRKYQSLKQGCAVASWLANVIMYDLDEKLSNLNGLYKRYCDDTIFVGKDYRKAMTILKDTMTEMSTPELNMQLKKEKVEYIQRNRWFKFLGFCIKGDKISLGSSRIKTFQHEIEKRTKDSGSNTKHAVHEVMRYLYVGDGEHSWATQVLPIINVAEDIDKLNEFVMDSIRATMTGRYHIGGLGYVREDASRPGCIARGIGHNVKANRSKTDARIEGYKSIRCMQHALKYNKALFYAMTL